MSNQESKFSEELYEWLKYIRTVTANTRYLKAEDKDIMEACITKHETKKLERAKNICQKEDLLKP